MSVSGNLFEVVPTTIGLHPAHFDTVMAEISIHRFFMPPPSTNDPHQGRRELTLIPESAGHRRSPACDGSATSTQRQRLPIRNQLLQLHRRRKDQHRQMDSVPIDEVDYCIRKHREQRQFQGLES